MTVFTDAIKKSNQGVLLSLHVMPGSSQAVFPSRFDQWRKSIEIKVRSEAKDNKANKEVLETVAGFFGLSAKDVVLVSGEKNRQKTVCLKKISTEVVTAKLQVSFHG
jgi:uncharacterized protein (TIGR00251 family)